MTEHTPMTAEAKTPELGRAEYLFERLQAIIDWADLALRNPQEFDSHGVRNLDGPVFDEARAALAKTQSSPDPEGLEGLPLDLAPRDGTMVWLLVDYSEKANQAAIKAQPNYVWPWLPLADANRAWTIGFNNLDNDGEDRWRFAGWCWSQDHFTEGRGKPLGWKPVGFDLEADDAG